MATTPTSVPGSDRRPGRAACPQAGAQRAGGVARGFTLVELLVVMVLIGLAAGAISLSLRDGDAARLDREAARLVALLEGARAEARASGVPVRLELQADGGFRFAGLPERLRPPEGWLHAEVQARVEPADASGGMAAVPRQVPQVLSLGPEPLIGAQRIVLTLGERQRALVTDGLAPFTVQDGSAAPAGATP